ncbi:lytic transglycosylase domain-containing protein [Rhizobium metallidurans]|uniref:Soluble lytic murein transglycosylase-like protein n=1 Tax=Rhizobium metallidurans TaxID=1265931 RepID=A0A7W6CNT2_9HYPH|nr:transglycosylase SLT domain-containing protein [Rhizobium metallidurans]MBB3963419.1 soluble lytic murein transglycosylase-like protein [Rhizobium metallidurans]
MRKIISAVVCASTLLMGFNCAFAGEWGNRAQTTEKTQTLKTQKTEKARTAQNTPAKAPKVQKTKRVQKVVKAEKPQKTVALKTADRTSGFAMPDMPGSKYAAIIVKYAREYNVPVELAQAVVRIESNYNPNARGSAGEIGLMQIKPATARMMGYSGSSKGLFDPDTNLKYGMKYLAAAQTLGGGETCDTILKYNAGHAATRMNPVSKAYCGKVLAMIN